MVGVNGLCFFSFATSETFRLPRAHSQEHAAAASCRRIKVEEITPFAEEEEETRKEKEKRREKRGASFEKR